MLDRKQLKNEINSTYGPNSFEKTPKRGFKTSFCDKESYIFI